jgi:hypothetical protein
MHHIDMYRNKIDIFPLIKNKTCINIKDFKIFIDNLFASDIFKSFIDNNKLFNSDFKKIFNSNPEYYKKIMKLWFFYKTLEYSINEIHSNFPNEFTLQDYRYIDVTKNELESLKTYFGYRIFSNQQLKNSGFN